MNRVRPVLSVRAQLTLWSVGVVAVALTLFGVGLRYSVERVLIEGLDYRLAGRTEPFVHPFRPHGDDGAMGTGLGPDSAALAGQEGPPPNGPGDGIGGPPDNSGDNPGDGGPPGGSGGPADNNGGPPDDNGGFSSGQQQNFGGPPMQPPGPPPDQRAHRPPAADPHDPNPPAVYDTRTGRSVEPRNGNLPVSPDGYAIAARTGKGVYTTVFRRGKPMRVLSRPFPAREDGHRLVVQLAMPMEDVDIAVAGVTRALLLLVPAALLLTAVGGVTLANRVLRPVGRLAEAAGNLQATELSARLPGEGNDEFGRLTGVLNGMLARLESAFDRQKRFAADASHELRTPLATIKAQTSLALEDDTLTLEEARASLASIDKATDRAERLVGDLLLLVKAGALPVRRETLDVRDLLAEVTRNSRARRAGISSATVRIDVADGLTVLSDRDHLLRLIGNLLDNALRYTPAENSVTLRAQPDLQRRGGVCIAVIDTGDGIAPEHVARLGEPFYRPDAARARKSGGTGLGLAICFGLAQSLGGKLEIQSALGSGTTAILTLPPAPTAAGPGASVLPSSPVAAAPPTSPLSATTPRAR